MRKNWTKNQDQVLRKIVGEVGFNDWTAVANRLKVRYQQIHRTGKQCRERWYNHLDPAVNKDVWKYEEQILLFELHRQLGNRWKEISLQLKGRTDNNIKNHFYSTLRRSLRRLNKVIGEKNSTLHMREIKPSVLTIILNFIYDHQEQTSSNSRDFIKDLKDLPKLIFEFAEFKPVKGNMEASKKQLNRQKIQTIFNLIETFKVSYYNQKLEKNKMLLEDQEEVESASQLTHQIITTEFKPLEKTVNVIINQQKQEESAVNNSMKWQSINGSVKWQSGEKEKSSSNRDKLMSEGECQLNMLELQQPSPITYIQDNNPFPELIVIGKHLSPRRQEVELQELDIDEILEMNYE